MGGGLRKTASITLCIALSLVVVHTVMETTGAKRERASLRALKDKDVTLMKPVPIPQPGRQCTFSTRYR
jgi:hypothetical protein